MIKEEGVTTVYKDGELIAVIKLDEKSRKKIIYTVAEADIEFITALMNGSILEKWKDGGTGGAVSDDNVKNTFKLNNSPGGDGGMSAGIPIRLIK